MSLRIAVCVKRVPAPGSRINVTADEQSVDAANLGFTTSPHEECAAEEAVQLVEKHGGSATVFTLGPPEAEEQLRYSASVGVEKAVLVSAAGGLDWDPQRTASALAQAIQSVEAREGLFDVVLFGNESADAGGFQVGIRVAHALGRPMVNGGKGIEITDSTVTVKRPIDAGFEVYTLPRPAVVGVKEGINLPRYPTMKGRLASKKVAVEVIEATADAGGQGRVRLHRPPEKASSTVILGTGHGPESASAVVDLLAELGVL
jgi:electron transfer flavoprotein beta subunit